MASGNNINRYKTITNKTSTPLSKLMILESIDLSTILDFLKDKITKQEILTANDWEQHRIKFMEDELKELLISRYKILTVDDYNTIKQANSEKFQVIKFYKDIIAATYEIINKYKGLERKNKIEQKITKSVYDDENIIESTLAIKITWDGLRRANFEKIKNKFGLKSMMYDEKILLTRFPKIQNYYGEWKKNEGINLVKDKDFYEFIITNLQHTKGRYVHAFKHFVKKYNKERYLHNIIDNKIIHDKIDNILSTIPHNSPVWQYGENLKEYINYDISFTKYEIKVNNFMNNLREAYKGQTLTLKFVKSLPEIFKIALFIPYSHYYGVFKTMSSIPESSYKFIWDDKDDVLKNYVFLLNEDLKTSDLRSPDFPMEFNNPSDIQELKVNKISTELVKYYKQLSKKMEENQKTGNKQKRTVDHYIDYILKTGREVVNEDRQIYYSVIQKINRLLVNIRVEKKKIKIIEHLKSNKSDDVKKESIKKILNTFNYNNIYTEFNSKVLFLPANEEKFYTVDKIKYSKLLYKNKIFDTLNEYQKKSENLYFEYLYWGTDDRNRFGDVYTRELGIEKHRGQIKTTITKELVKQKMTDILQKRNELVEKYAKQGIDIFKNLDISDKCPEVGSQTNKPKYTEYCKYLTTEIGNNFPLFKNIIVDNKTDKIIKRPYVFGGDTNDVLIFRECTYFFHRKPWIDEPGRGGTTPTNYTHKNIGSLNQLDKRAFWNLSYNLAIVNCIWNSPLIFPCFYIIPKNKERYTPFPSNDSNLKFIGNIIVPWNDTRRFEGKRIYSIKDYPRGKKGYTILNLFYKKDRIYLYSSYNKRVQPVYLYEALKVWYVELYTLIKQYGFYPYLYNRSVDDIRTIQTIKNKFNNLKSLNEDIPDRLLLLSKHSPSKLSKILDKKNIDLKNKLSILDIEFPKRGGIIVQKKDMLNRSISNIYKEHVRQTGGNDYNIIDGYTYQIISGQIYDWKIIIKKFQEYVNFNIFPHDEFKKIINKLEHFNSKYTENIINLTNLKLNKYIFIKQRRLISISRVLLKKFPYLKNTIILHNFIFPTMDLLEILNKFKIKCNKNIIFSRNFSIIEMIYIYNKRKNIKIDAHVLKYYIFYKRKNYSNYAQIFRDKLKKIYDIHFNNINSPINYDYIQDNFININKKYDFFFGDMMSFDKELHYSIREHLNNQLFISLLLILILTLQEKGDAIIIFPSVKTTLTANIIFLLGQIFEKTFFYYAEIAHQDHKKFNYFICKGYKGYNQEIVDQLSKLVQELDKRDPSGGLNYNVLDPKLRKELDITKPITKDTPTEYLQSFLKIDNPEPFYKQIYDFNMFKLQKYDKYLDEIQYYIDNIEGNPEREKEYQLYQLFNSKQYAEKLGLRLKKDFDKQIFSDYFQKELLEDMFALEKGIKLKFKTRDSNKKLILKPTEIKIREPLQKILDLIDEAKQAIVSRNAEKYESVKRIYSLYNKGLIKLLENKYNIKDVDNEWITTFEILSVFPRLLRSNVYISCLMPQTNSAIQYYQTKHNHPKNNTISINYELKNSKEIKIIEGKCEDNIYDGVKYMLENIPKGANCLLKLDLNINMNIISLIYVIFCQFEQIYFYKTMKNPESNIFHIIAYNYKELTQKLPTSVKPEDSVVSSIPESFMFQLQYALRKLIENYDRYVEKEIYYIDNIDNISKEHIKDMSSTVIRKNLDWVEEFLI